MEMIEKRYSGDLNEHFGNYVGAEIHFMDGSDNIYVHVMESNCVALYNVSATSIFDYYTNISKEKPQIIESYADLGESTGSKYADELKLVSDYFDEMTSID